MRLNCANDVRTESGLCQVERVLWLGELWYVVMIEIDGILHKRWLAMGGSFYPGVL